MTLQVIHARSGVPWEIMGLMQGKVVGHSIVIMDSFALPVQGTETRVNAANEANEYMVQYIQESEKVCYPTPCLGITLDKLTQLTGGTTRECDWLVPFSSWVRLLALGYRCQHTNEQPEIHRSIRCCCGALLISNFLSPILMMCGID